MLVPALILLSSTAFAQVKFAPEVGLNMYNQTLTTTNTSTTGKMLPGLRVGIMADLPITDHFAVQPGLLYNLNRTQTEMSWGNAVSVTANRSMHALQIPVYFLYKSGTEGSGRFFGGIGPNFTYALSGNDHTTANVLGLNGDTDRKMKFGSDSGDDMKPFNVEGTVTLGYELASGAYIRANYNFGLLNQLPKGDSDNGLKNMSFGVSLGYLLK